MSLARVNFFETRQFRYSRSDIAILAVYGIFRQRTSRPGAVRAIARYFAVLLRVVKTNATRHQDGGAQQGRR